MEIVTRFACHGGIITQNSSNLLVFGKIYPMSIELLASQEIILDQLRKITEDKEKDSKEFFKSQTLDSYWGGHYGERRTNELIGQAEDMGIAYPEVISTIVKAIPALKQKEALNSYFFCGNGKLTEKEAKEIAEELGIRDFNPSDFWETRH